MPGTEQRTDVVVREVTIDASPETIFPFFTEPEKMLRWKGIEADLDPQPGGVYRVVVTPRNTARGEYVTIEPNSRVVFTWGWEDPNSPVQPGTSTVEITLRPEGAKTVVRLEHRDFPSSEAATAHVEGWDHFLERLSIAAAGGDPGTDPWIENKGEE
ncbi:MAG TPA: SRPBCC domain-containing protein [Actinomycetota bacterium]|nr:SRPBCC domain-containing protein [Actinomycetota bacterium]